MSIFLESLFVGLYTIIIYSIITFLKLKINIYQQLFIVGFFKHFMGYVLGLHKLYIDYGYACKNYLSKNIKNDTIPTQTIYNYLLLFISSVFDLRTGKLLYVDYTGKITSDLKYCVKFPNINSDTLTLTNLISLESNKIFSKFKSSDRYNISREIYCNFKL